MGVFKIRYPLPSETFVTTQARALARYEPLVLARQRSGATDLPTLAASDHDPFGVRQGWLALSRSPAFFLQDERVRNLSLLHAHSGPEGVYALRLAERLAIPLVVTFHGQDATSRGWPLFRSLCGVTVVTYFLHLRRLRERGAAFIAVSDVVRDALLSRGFPPGKIHRHYIGVDTDTFRPLPETDRRGGERYILNVARHMPVKGVATLLRAFAEIAREHPAVTLMQVGAGPLTASLRQLTRELGLEERVRFLGLLPHERVLALMQRAEIAALTSETAASGAREALGMVLNEGSACGIPIVATRSGGIPEAVVDGETGLLSPERDVRSLAANLARLLRDGELRQRLGREGREFVCARFDLRKQTAELERLYDRVIRQT